MSGNIGANPPGYGGVRHDILDSFNFSGEILDEAIKVLNSPDKADKELSNLFDQMKIDKSQYHSGHVKYLNVRFNEVKKINNAIITSPNRKLKFKMDEKPAEYAFVNSDDAGYHVNLTSAFVKELGFLGKVDTVLHEISHFHTDELVGTLDMYYFYSSEKEPDDGDNYLSLRISKAQHLSDSIKNNTPRDKEFIFKGSDENNYDADVTEMAVANADHVALMAMHLGRSAMQ